MDAVNAVVNLSEKTIAGIRWEGGTEKYYAIITFDVRNALNSAQWQHIKRSLTQLNVFSYIQLTIRNYFVDMKLLYDTDVGSVEYLITGAVPQGLVLGALSWNAMYNHVLRIKLPWKTTFIGYADEIAIVVVEKHLEYVIWPCETSVRLIKDLTYRVIPNIQFWITGSHGDSGYAGIFIVLDLTILLSVLSVAGKEQFSS